ncbi:MAG: hypothetical protein M1837_000521 [Sclerophora amabilis]|nr:MAG: hypothetical protein M1837_000521 [Sclerophora amabilis]
MWFLRDDSRQVKTSLLLFFLSLTEVGSWTTKKPASSLARRDSSPDVICSDGFEDCVRVYDIKVALREGNEGFYPDLHYQQGLPSSRNSYTKRQPCVEECYAELFSCKRNTLEISGEDVTVESICRDALKNNEYECIFDDEEDEMSPNFDFDLLDTGPGWPPIEDIESSCYDECDCATLEKLPEEEDRAWLDADDPESDEDEVAPCG